MPDDVDYAWLEWLIRHPTEWSPEDAEKAAFVLDVQRRDLDTLHPRDLRGRRSKQDLVDQLESAIAAYRSTPRRERFVPGDRVVFEDGTTGVVHAPGDEHSVVVWDDEPDEGGSRVANEKLRRLAE